jgi:hypothetical protein
VQGCGLDDLVDGIGELVKAADAHQDGDVIMRRGGDQRPEEVPDGGGLAHAAVEGGQVHGVGLGGAIGLLLRVRQGVAEGGEHGGAGAVVLAGKG